MFHSRHAEPSPTVVLPFGRYGAGHLTGHPIGLVIVLGFLLMGALGVPEYRWFVAGSVLIGALVGFLLWLYHRSA